MFQQGPRIRYPSWGINKIWQEPINRYHIEKICKQMDIIYERPHYKFHKYSAILQDILFINQIPQYPFYVLVYVIYVKKKFLRIKRASPFNNNICLWRRLCDVFGGLFYRFLSTLFLFCMVFFFVTRSSPIQKFTCWKEKVKHFVSDSCTRLTCLLKTEEN